MLNFTIEDLPEEILVNILSWLPLSSVVKVSGVDHKFARISQTKEIWQNLIRCSFPHLCLSNAITYQNRPKKLFIEEHQKWQMFSALAKIDLSLIYSALENDMSKIMADQQLTAEQRTVLDILNAAATGKQNPLLTTQQDQKFYAAFLKHFNPGLETNQRMFCTMDVSDDMRAPLQHLNQMDKIDFSIHKFDQFFQEVAIAKTDAKSAEESFSLFDKLGYLTSEEIELLKEAIEELCIMLSDRADLTPAQAAVLSKCDFSEQEQQTMVALFDEQFGEKVLQSPVKYAGKAFTNYEQLILHFCGNVFFQFGDMLIEKCERELALRTQATTMPAITPQFAIASASSTTKRSEENSPLLPHIPTSPRL